MNNKRIGERYGFRFWLGWILGFGGSFVLAAVVWTWIIERVIGGAIKGAEWTITWMVAVFGSWLVMVVPFMRKKERIWKRLNEDQERAVDAWFAGMGIFAGLLVAAALFWSWRFKDEISFRASGLDPAWAKRVFGTWLFIWLPFLVWMYRQADRIFKNAVIRQTAVPSFRSVYVEPSKRLLPAPILEKLKNVPCVLPRGHIVNVRLKDGRKVSNVFVLDGREILGVYDVEVMDFEGKDVVDIEVVSKEDMPVYEEARWLRVDGKNMG